MCTNYLQISARIAKVQDTLQIKICAHYLNPGSQMFVKKTHFMFLCCHIFPTFTFDVYRLEN